MRLVPALIQPGLHVLLNELLAALLPSPVADRTTAQVNASAAGLVGTVS
jgi:hypothetical protein